MAEQPFDPALPAGRSGAPAEPPGITVTRLSELAILSLVARKGQRQKLADRLADRLGLGLPIGPRYVAGRDLAAIGIGPDRWLLIAEASDSYPLFQKLANETAGLAAVADLSDAFAAMRLAGPAARAVMAKGLPLDLHPTAFAPGDAATSAAALIPLHLWQRDEAPTYEILVPRSLAASFAVWMTESAAEFGMLVEG